MPDLVNATAKERLAPRNSEPTHLNTGSYEKIGGPSVTSEPNGPDYKIDAERGVGTDTSIPHAVSGEPSHLKQVEEDDDVDVNFADEDAADGDDLDADLDDFEDIDPVDVDVEDELQEEDEKDEDEKDELHEDDEKTEKEDEKDAEEAEDKALHEEDEKDDEDKDELHEDDNPFAKKDEDGDEKESEEKKEKADDDDLKESVKIRVKMPKLSLNESVIPAKNQKRVAVLFEQAIKDTTKQVAAQMYKHYKQLHESKLANRDAAMAKQVDAYLSYVTEEWLKANRVQVRQSLRAQLAEEFLDGLQKLFKEHYIDVPESKVDVVKKLTEQNEKLRKSLNEQVETKIKLKKLAEKANKSRIVAESCQHLSETETVKVQKLAENVSYGNAKDFRQKLSVLMETYIPKKATKKTADLPEAEVKDGKLITEEKKTKKTVITDDADINALADILTRQSAAEKW